MKKKIIFASLLSIAISIGAIFLINKAPKKEVLPRDYILVTTEGKTNYPFPLVFEKGVSVSEVISLFASTYEKIQRRQGTRLITLDPEQILNSDVKIKIS